MIYIKVLENGKMIMVLFILIIKIPVIVKNNSANGNVVNGDNDSGKQYQNAIMLKVIMVIIDNNSNHDKNKNNYTRYTDNDGI